MELVSSNSTQNKPVKYGLLFKSINGARYLYSFVSVPYCGKPKNEPTEEYKQGRFGVAKHMVGYSRINASTVLALNKKDDPRKVNSLDFEWELVQNLTTPFTENRSLDGLSSMVEQMMCVILKTKITSRNPSAQLFPSRNKQRKNAGYVSMIHIVLNLNL